MGQTKEDTIPNIDPKVRVSLIKAIMVVTTVAQVTLQRSAQLTGKHVIHVIKKIFQAL